MPRRPSSSAASHWTFDADACRLLLELPNSHYRGLSVAAARGWVELEEGELVGTRLSFRMPPGDPDKDAGSIPGGWDFQGSAVRRGPEDEMVVEGRLRVGDRVESLTLAVIPIRYHRRGGTEYFDLDVSGTLPPGNCGASRVEGRIRVFRASPAA